MVVVVVVVVRGEWWLVKVWRTRATHTTQGCDDVTDE